jgi:UDP-N-acetylmuramate dehydrogenase
MTNIELIENKSLRQHNTFGMDVYARWFTEVQSEDALRSALEWAGKSAGTPFILGGGSNILFTRNVDGLVIANAIPGVEVVKEDKTCVWIKAGAGVRWHALVEYCIRNDYSGIENLALIPGNVGAYGVEIKDVFDSLTAMDLHDKSMQVMDAASCDFGYRESKFKRAWKNKYVITSITLRLNKIPKYHIEYGAIARELENMGVKELSIRAVADAVIKIRTGKLPDPAVIGNAGSFFKNPEVTAETYHALKQTYPDIAGYALENGKVKLAAGWLIEHSGPAMGVSWKGYRKGDAGCHAMQALVLVNHAHASGNDILELSEQIIASVQQKFGVTLEREVNVY